MKLIVDNIYTCQKCSWRFDVSIFKSQNASSQPSFVEWKTWPTLVRCAFNYTDWIGTKKLYVNFFADTPIRSLNIAEEIVKNPADYVSVFCPKCWLLTNEMKLMPIKCHLSDDDKDRDADGFGGAIGEKFNFIAECDECDARISLSKSYYGADYALEGLVKSAYLKGLRKKENRKGVRVSLAGAANEDVKKKAAKKVCGRFSLVAKPRKGATCMSRVLSTSSLLKVII